MAIDDLKILITGDASGIASAIKKSVNIVQGGVKEMNSQEVDWTGIFSRSVSPAIISGVASVFAFAISQSLSFQTAMAMTGTAAGESSAQIAQMSRSALDLSTTVPASAQDIAQAMAQVSAIFGKTADQQTVVAALAELSASGFGDLGDITTATTDIFKQFGVTTTDQAITVLTSLMHAAEAAKESIPALASQFSGFSSQLPGVNKNVGSFNNLIATFGAEVQNLGSAGAVQIFDALAHSANNAVGPMELLGTSFAKVQKSLLTDGGLSAIAATSQALLKMGPGASLVATQFGLSAQQVGQFQTNASKLPQIASDAKNIANNAQSITDAFNQANVGTNRLLTDWNKFKASFLDSSFWNGVAKFGLFFADSFVGAISQANDELDGLFNGLKNLATQDPALKQLAGALGPLGPSTGTGQSAFSANALQKIAGTAGNSSMIDSLVSALSTGIKQGQYTSLVNTFHLNVPAGATGLTAKAIAQQLYQQFQGTQ